MPHLIARGNLLPIPFHRPLGCRLLLNLITSHLFTSLLFSLSLLFISSHLFSSSLLISSLHLFSSSPSHLISSHLISSLLISSHFISSHLISSLLIKRILIPSWSQTTCIAVVYVCIQQDTLAAATVQARTHMVHGTRCNYFYKTGCEPRVTIFENRFFRCF